MWRRQSGEHGKQFDRGVPRQAASTDEESVYRRRVKRVFALYEREGRAGVDQDVFTFGRQAAAP